MQWGLIQPEKLPSSRRRRTLELTSVILEFNELAVPGLGGLWFVKRAALAAPTVPGLLHLLSKSAEPPFGLMHAKVALLGFRNPLDPLNWSLRLLVSTGNWTRQTS